MQGKRVSEENITEMDQEIKDKYEAHGISKIETKIERDVDRSNLSIPLLCFYLRFFFRCPGAMFLYFSIKGRLLHSTSRQFFHSREGLEKKKLMKYIVAFVPSLRLDVEQTK